jgi:hypothetical protein
LLEEGSQVITFRAGSRRPLLADVIERDGRTYKRRGLAAMNVRDGDLIPAYDLTGEPGTVGEYGLGEVWHVDKWSAVARPTPWHRVEIHARNWRGTLRSWAVPTGSITYAPRDRVEVWRPTA